MPEKAGPLQQLAPGLQMRVLRPGEGQTSKTGDIIWVHYTGWLEDSTRFDSSRDRNEPLRFVLGGGQVIPGWETGLQGMQAGEIRELFIAPEMGYGARAIGPIPANASLRFQVEMLKIQKGSDPDAFSEMKDVQWKTKQPGVEYADKAGSQGRGPEARSGSALQLHYTGWLSNGQEFSSSRKSGTPAEILIGAGEVIRGWEIGLQGVRAGQIRYLRIQPQFGYGATPLARIPAHSVLLFKVEVLDVKSNDNLNSSMDIFPDLETLEFTETTEGLRYSIVQQGMGEAAAAGTNVKVHYTGWLLDGTMFDSSRPRQQPLEFPLGAGRVVRGWDLGVQGMKPGEKRYLVIPPNLAYGARATGPIPPNSTLVFLVEYMGQ